MMKKEIELKEIQAIAMNILGQIAKLCEELNLRYYLIYGTLLGAVRHQGYIPWDDDLDIMMPREDHDILIAYLRENIAKYHNLEVFNHENNPKYPYMITRISDQRYRLIMNNEKEYGMGVFVDIYPFDGLGQTKKEALRYARKGDLLSSLCYQATRRRFAFEATRTTLRKIVKLPIFIVAHLCGKNFFQARLQKLARVKSYDKNEYVGCIIWHESGAKTIFPRKWFEGHQILLFGSESFRVPIEYEAFLEHVYGDYMKLPPLKDRVGRHGYKIFER